MKPSFRLLPCLDGGFHVAGSNRWLQRHRIGGCHSELLFDDFRHASIRTRRSSVALRWCQVARLSRAASRCATRRSEGKSAGPGRKHRYGTSSPHGRFGRSHRLGRSWTSHFFEVHKLSEKSGVRREGRKKGRGRQRARKGKRMSTGGEG